MKKLTVLLVAAALSGCAGGVESEGAHGFGEGDPVVGPPANPCCGAPGYGYDRALGKPDRNGNIPGTTGNVFTGGVAGRP